MAFSIDILASNNRTRRRAFDCMFDELRGFAPMGGDEG